MKKVYLVLTLMTAVGGLTSQQIYCAGQFPVSSSAEQQASWLLARSIVEKHHATLLERDLAQEQLQRASRLHRTKLFIGGLSLLSAASWLADHIPVAETPGFSWDTFSSPYKLLKGAAAWIPTILTCATSGAALYGGGFCLQESLFR